VSTDRGQWHRKTTAARRRLRERIAEAERLADAAELRWNESRFPGEPLRIWPDAPGAVIESSSFAAPEPRAEVDGPEIEPHG
jgi:hypothetical protein